MDRFKVKNWNLCTALALLLILSVISSCTKRMRFQKSDEVPAAEGSVKVKKDKNNNYKIDLRIVRLAEPERLDPPRNTYVVWMETEDNGTIKVGGLTTSSGIFSKTLKSSLQTVTPYRPERFFITGEKNTEVEYPGSRTILKTTRY